MQLIYLCRLNRKTIIYLCTRCIKYLCYELSFDSFTNETFMPLVYLIKASVWELGWDVEKQAEFCYNQWYVAKLLLTQNHGVNEMREQRSSPGCSNGQSAVLPPERPQASDSHHCPGGGGGSHYARHPADDAHQVRANMGVIEDPGW